MVLSDVAKALRLKEICREYLTGLTMEVYRRSLPKETLEHNKRHCEVCPHSVITKFLFSL